MATGQNREVQASVTNHNGLTFASINGREVCPDILIVHGSVPLDQAAYALARLRNLRAGTQSATNQQTDLEWDPD